MDGVGMTQLNRLSQTKHVRASLDNHTLQQTFDRNDEYVIYVQTHIGMYACTSVCTYICQSVCMYVCMYGCDILMRVGVNMVVFR